MIFRQDAPSRYPSLSPRRYLARSALPRERFRSLAQLRPQGKKTRCGAARCRRGYSNCRASDRGHDGGSCDGFLTSALVPVDRSALVGIRNPSRSWPGSRPVSKQVIPCWSRSSASFSDPFLTFRCYLARAAVSPPCHRSHSTTCSAPRVFADEHSEVDGRLRKPYFYPGRGYLTSIV